MKALQALLVMVVFTALLTGSLHRTARADDSAADVGSAKKPPHVIYEKEQEQRYSGAQLKGQLKKPELSYIYQRKGLRAERIVNVPENFDEEIISGAGQF